MTSGGPRSRWVDIGIPVHYLDFGGPETGPVVVAVHGLVGAAINWLAMGPLLTRRYRVLAPDLAGHGLTQARGRSASVHANRALLHEFVTAVAGEQVILMGNSMGAMIALMEAGRERDAVAGLILLDPPLPFPATIPDPTAAAAFAFLTAPLLGSVLVPHWRRLPPERLVSLAMRFCCVDPSRVPGEIVAEHVKLIRRRAEFVGADRDLLEAARSVAVTTRVEEHRSRYRDAIAAVRAPVLILHGEQDRFIPAAASRAIAHRNSAWQLAILPDVGHVPQLEAPEAATSIVMGWLDGPGIVPARSAGHPFVDQVALAQ